MKSVPRVSAERRVLQRQLLPGTDAVRAGERQRHWGPAQPEQGLWHVSQGAPASAQSRRAAPRRQAQPQRSCGAPDRAGQPAGEQCLDFAVYVLKCWGLVAAGVPPYASLSTMTLPAQQKGKWIGA